jgi:DNA-binding CsgD family transcriptional regulator
MGLTARQLQVVVLLADGLRADDIAQRLGIATSTVYRYVERAKERTGVTSRSELVALAIRERLVRADTDD